MGVDDLGAFALGSTHSAAPQGMPPGCRVQVRCQAGHVDTPIVVDRMLAAGAKHGRRFTVRRKYGERVDVVEVTFRDLSRAPRIS